MDQVSTLSFTSLFLLRKITFLFFLPQSNHSSQPILNTLRVVSIGQRSQCWSWVLCARLFIEKGCQEPYFPELSMDGQQDAVSISRLFSANTIHNRTSFFPWSLSLSTALSEQQMTSNFLVCPHFHLSLFLFLQTGHAQSAGINSVPTSFCSLCSHSGYHLDGFLP